MEIFKTYFAFSLPITIFANKKIKMMRRLLCSVYVILIFSFTISCTVDIPINSTVYVVPVYGQSLALGEEAKMVTNFDTLKVSCNHRVRTELLDEQFGYFSNTIFKQKLKRIFRNRKRTFEVSCYGLGEYLANKLNDTIYICTFPAGQGNTGINGLSKGTPAYEKLIEQIKQIKNIAERKNLNVVMPAFCWHQGENDLVWNTSIDYKKQLKSFRCDLEDDVNAIFRQKRHLKCILYQTNCLTKRFI